MSRRSTLDAEEQALWDKVIATVTPLHAERPRPEPQPMNEKRHSRAGGNPSDLDARPRGGIDSRLRGSDAKESLKRNIQPRGNLDSHWDRRFKKGVIEPDVSIDLHGIGLAGAYQRLDGALEQAVHQGLRVVLLVTGKPRSHDRASGEGRGAIASVVRDWLAASRHAPNIATVRGAHPRHGGTGAIYIILKR